MSLRVNPKSTSGAATGGFWIYRGTKVVAFDIMGPFGYSLLGWKLKTENWKHCNKIIFKCVNSVIGPIFNEKVAEKWSLWVPCMCCWNVHCTLMKSQQLRLKKEKKKEENAKRESKPHLC